MSAPAAELLKISELAEQSGVPVATVRHYLREGLLPEPVKTSRNMAYYPPEFVDRIRLIKQLQEERFMPLRVIRDLLDREDAEPERLRAMIELEDRILEQALAGEREMVVELDQPHLGPVRQLGLPVKMSRTPGRVEKPAPALGEHTEDVLREAGYTDEQIAAMTESGAAAGPTAGSETAFMA